MCLGVVVNDGDDVFVVGDVCSGCGGTSDHGRGSLTIWLGTRF